MPPPVYLRGRQIVLGPVDPADAPLYAAWVNDPAVWPYLNRPRPATEAEERARVASLVGAADAVGFSVRRRSDLALVGRTAIRGIHPSNRTGVFTIFIGEPSARSRGFGREATALTTLYAMDVLNLNRLELEVFGYNERAVRLYEGLGFVREGARREAKYHDGAYHDAILMAIVAREWRAGLRERHRAFLDETAAEPAPAGTGA